MNSFAKVCFSAFSLVAIIGGCKTRSLEENTSTAKNSDAPFPFQCPAGAEIVYACTSIHAVTQNVQDRRHVYALLCTSNGAFSLGFGIADGTMKNQKQPIFQKAARTNETNTRSSYRAVFPDGPTRLVIMLPYAKDSTDIYGDLDSPKPGWALYCKDK